MLLEIILNRNDCFLDDNPVDFYSSISDEKTKLPTKITIIEGF